MADAKWSYHVLVVKNLDPRRHSRARWLSSEPMAGKLVSSLTTVKTWLNMTGNDLVFVFKKEGLGHVVQWAMPTVEQETYLRTLLTTKGFSDAEVRDLSRRHCGGGGSGRRRGRGRVETPRSGKLD